MDFPFSFFPKFDADVKEKKSFEKKPGVGQSGGLLIIGKSVEELTKCKLGCLLVTQKKRKHKIMAPNRLPLTLLVLAQRIMLICELVPKWIRVTARVVLLKYSNSTTYCLPPSYVVGI